MAISDSESNQIRKISIMQGWPALKTDPEFEITSSKSEKYNCFAWAIRTTDICIAPYPEETADVTWPSDIPRDESVDSYVALFARHRFQECTSSKYEPGYEKIAIYFSKTKGRVTHAARQLSDNSWTSKLGDLEDISHSVSSLQEPVRYGQIVKYMKRPHQNGASPLAP